MTRFVQCILAPILLGCFACYNYQPVAAPGPMPGKRINAGLTSDGARAMLPVLGPDIAEIEGWVVDAGRDTLRVAVLGVTSQRGIPTSWRGEEVPLPREGLAYVGERRFSRGGTVLLSAGLMGGLYFLYRLLGGPGIFEGGGARGGGGGR
jgi:hypothetical protein